MRLTVLTDNTARIDAYYLAEAGVSYYIQDGGKNILFDTGYSDVYVRNAEAMQIDLRQLDMIVFSHGHNDHTGGLRYLPEDIRDIRVLAHPDAFKPKRYDGESIGTPIELALLASRFRLEPSSVPVALTDRLFFLGEIPRTNSFENTAPIGERLFNGIWESDYVLDDSALVYCGEDGLTIITGCSHSGICNITEYAKAVCGDDRIAGIIGGNIPASCVRAIAPAFTPAPRFIIRFRSKSSAWEIFWRFADYIFSRKSTTRSSRVVY